MVVAWNVQFVRVRLHAALYTVYGCTKRVMWRMARGTALSGTAVRSEARQILTNFRALRAQANF